MSGDGAQPPSCHRKGTTVERLRELLERGQPGRDRFVRGQGHRLSASAEHHPDRPSSSPRSISRHGLSVPENTRRSRVVVPLHLRRAGRPGALGRVLSRAFPRSRVRGCRQPTPFLNSARSCRIRTFWPACGSNSSDYGTIVPQSAEEGVTGLAERGSCAGWTGGVTEVPHEPLLEREDGAGQEAILDPHR